MEQHFGNVFKKTTLTAVPSCINCPVIKTCCKNDPQLNTNVNSFDVKAISLN